MTTTKKEGWVCPKCQRVWGPLVQHCFHCNREVKQDEQKPQLRITKVYEDGRREPGRSFRDSLSDALHEGD